jgi:hypothetical protein
MQQALLCTCSSARSIQQSAALALGRLANYSDDLAEAVVQNEILPQLVRLCMGSWCFTCIFCVTGELLSNQLPYR